MEIDFGRFSFDETRHLNRLIDYELYRTKRTWVQKLFIQPNNPLSLYKYQDEKGYVMVEDSTSSVYKVKINDYKGNDVWVTIPIEGAKSENIEHEYIQATEHFVYADQTSALEMDNVKVDFPKHTFYDDFFIDFKVENDTVYLHQSTIPAQKNFYINFDISHYNKPDKDKLYVASISKFGKVYYANTEKKGNTITCSTKYLGTYTLVSDTENPTIEAVNFQDGKWLSKYRYLRLKIDDEQSGVKNYRATVNGKWILMEYDYKKNTLTHDFNDGVITDTKNILKVIVTDNVGNSSTFETTFYRK